MDRTNLDLQLANRIAEALNADIEANNCASLLVSGGSTPKGLFKLLSETELDWSKVTIGLVDDRFLPDAHKDLNAAMVNELLLVNQAAAANFIPLVFDANDFANNMEIATEMVREIPRPFSCVVLGMGGDSHTASLFPEDEALKAGMDKNNPNDLIGVVPPVAPYHRVSFTRRALLNSKNLFLHIYGDDKKEVFETAKTSGDELTHPIAGFINQPELSLELFWAS
jgi:6-phosphogluconolactonase